jgi:peroxiredoxin
MVVALLVGLSRAAPVEQLGSNKVGNTFPDHVGIDVSHPGTDLTSPGDLLTLPSARYVFVAFFQTTCVPCLAEITQLAQGRARLHEKGIEVLLVGVQEDPSDLRKLIKTRGWDFPVIADRFDGEYSHQCGIITKAADGNEIRRIPSAALLCKGKNGDLVLEAAWQGEEPDIVQHILTAAK